MSIDIRDEDRVNLGILFNSPTWRKVRDNIVRTAPRSQGTEAQFHQSLIVMGRSQGWLECLEYIESLVQPVESEIPSDKTQSLDVATN